MTEEIKSKDERYWEWFYSSKMRIKRRVLRMEREAAKRLSFLLTESKPLKDQQFASDLEWLLTWKLKTGCCPEFMWCDGVEFEEITSQSERTIQLKGTAWVGPEKNDELFQVPIEAEMSLRPSGKKFKKYCFRINYQGNIFEPKRT